MSPTPSLPNEITYTEFRKAYNSCKRRETRKPDGTVRQRAGAFTYLYRHTTTSISCSLDPKSSSKTAMWEWATKGGRPYHNIKVHPDCAEAFFDGSRGTPSRRVELTKAVIAHETCHGLYTSRTSAPGKECHDLRLPFRLLNLMEDARIEWKYVKDRGKEHRFRWNLFDDKVARPKTEIKSPTEWLYVMKTREPILFKAIGSVMAPYIWGGEESISIPVVTYDHPLKDYEGSRVAFRVLINMFYVKIVDRSTTEALIPLVRLWTDIFGKESSSELPPIIVHTVPDSFGGIKDPDEGGGADEGADSTTRTVDHTPVAKALPATPVKDHRATIEPTKVIHHNTDAYLRQALYAGFAPLSEYLCH